VGIGKWVALLSHSNVALSAVCRRIVAALAALHWLLQCGKSTAMMRQIRANWANGQFKNLKIKIAILNHHPHSIAT
jgi:hypothetical protein